MNTILENFIYKAISACFLALGLIPREAALRLAGFIGHIWFVVDQRHRTVAVENLTHVYGREKTSLEIRGLALRIFKNLAMILFEIGWSLRFKEKDFFKFFKIAGLENIRSAYARGKGVLALTAHIGNWELLMLAAGLLGLPMSAIYRPFDFKPLDRFFSDLRTRYGARLYPKSRAMRKILRSMKDGEMVGFLLDQNTNLQSGVFVDFFGKPACTHKGMAALALGTGAPVVSAFLVREDAGFRVEFGPEIPLIRTGDKDKDIIENTRQYNHAIESIILRYPEQWFWVHRRWKTRPKAV
ncbi:MAG: lysophospholipid acyltransferase family protein [Desulfobacterales bacterium]|jgi:KDO2-lipid IV(A) lauroyltransferase|nr:lysophospholipid acyltransferase family protein [Desulfobacterales bacterium]